MCVGQVSSGTIAPDVAKYANETDQKILIQIMLRRNSARQISRRLHMSGMRFRQIQETGIISDKIANRLNEIEGVEIFKANHPRVMSERERVRAWNEKFKFDPSCQNFRLFAQYFIEWAQSGRKLGE